MLPGWLPNPAGVCESINEHRIKAYCGQSLGKLHPACTSTNN